MTQVLGSDLGPDATAVNVTVVAVLTGLPTKVNLNSGAPGGIEIVDGRVTTRGFELVNFRVHSHSPYALCKFYGAERIADSSVAL